MRSSHEIAVPPVGPGRQQRDRNGLVKLSRGECLSFLRTASIGRVALTEAALPVILPVNFAVFGDDVVFCTGTGAKLRAATDRAIVAFEADDVDLDSGTGWSVCITGMTSEVTDPITVARAEDLRIRPLVPVDRQCYISVRSDVVSGRLLLPLT